MRWVSLILFVMMAETSGLRAADTLAVVQPEENNKPQMSWLRRTIRGFSYIDENYVEPQHYNWSLMAQATYTYDYYRLSTTNPRGQSVSFAPKAGMKVGPYFGWRWIFLGYTFDLRNIDFSKNSIRQELDFSIYSAQIGADLYYRRSGSNYMIRRADLGSGIDSRQLKDVPFDGISVGITGFNVYYIFNHQRFSYPAAFAQSTRQKISCGSWMVGLGYTRNSIDFNYKKLEELVNERCAPQKVELDSGLMFNSVKYYDVNASVGYAYNWVFARNWLFCSSLSIAVAYKKTRGETDTKKKMWGFDLDNLNLDGIGRFGLIYNDNRWYTGASAIVRAYNYKKERFAANNIFGYLNVYIGYNFGTRGRYKKLKK